MTMELYSTENRRRSSVFSGISYLTADSGISSVASGNPHFSDVNSELFVSQATGKGYPIIQTNGCMQFGPPLNYHGEEPESECELYIKDFPKDFKEFQLIPHFERFGDIYDFRLMMDYDNNNRGYAYLRFQKKESAALALEVMKYFFLPNGTTLQVQKSYNKCRLFVGNLPTDVPQKHIEDIFMYRFPKICNISLYVNHQSNHAYGFLDFPDHKSALEVKMATSSGVTIMFNRQVKIVWAVPERQVPAPIESTVKTLFIRNIGLRVTTNDIKTFLLKCVNSKSIKKISPVRDFAFVELTSHEVAKKIKDELNGQIISQTKIEIEYARPPSEDSVHKQRQADYDQNLRLKCVANYWEMPIYIFGRAYEEKKIQNVCVIIKKGREQFYYFCEINYTELFDIQSRIAEVIVKLIDNFSFLPLENLVIKVDKEYFAVVGFMKNMNMTPTFVPYIKYHNVTIYFEEFLDLALMANVLGNHDTDQLFFIYKNHINSSVNTAFIENLNVNGRVLSCIYPHTRSFYEPSATGLRNQEMVFVLCCGYYYNNVKFFNKIPNEYTLQNFFKNGVIYQHQYIISMHLLPLRFIQCKRSTNRTTFSHITYKKLNDPNEDILNQFQQATTPPWFVLPKALSKNDSFGINAIDLMPTNSKTNNKPVQVPETPLTHNISNAF